MNLSKRNNSFNFKRSSNQATCSFLQKRLSSASKKVQNMESPNTESFFRSSGSCFKKQKSFIYQHVNELNKSADVAYFISKQRFNSEKGHQQLKNPNYAYIGQIQALQRRKLRRKGMNRQLKAQKKSEETSQISQQTQKDNGLGMLDKIAINQLKNNIAGTKKQRMSQVQVEQLHYKMVITQQRCKKILRHE